MNKIIFYFDFSSSYSYIAQAKVAKIIEQTGVEVVWQPILLGVIFKQSGHVVPVDHTVKMNYLNRDLSRQAEQLGISYQTPVQFPFNSIHCARAFYFLFAKNPEQGIQFAQRAFNAAYAEQLDISQLEVVYQLLESMDISPVSVFESPDYEQAKAVLKDATQSAMDSGVFGAPSFVYGDELFWGADRVDDLIRFVNKAQQAG